MTRILFLVHGMGVHGKDWSSPVQEQLGKLPSRYGYDWFGQNGDLGAHVKLVPISYDDVFSRHLTKWAKSSTAIDAFAKEHGIRISRVLGWLGSASATQKNFFWSHVCDVLLYRLFQIVTAEVRLRVRVAIAEKLEAAMKNGKPVDASVLAHSLGTAVTHDALSLLASQPIKTKKGKSKAFMVGNFSFQNVFMLANVSRILETSEKVYTSAVHPLTVRPDDAYTASYCDFRHDFDPIPAFKAFSPEGWGDGFLHVGEHKRILRFNTHDFTHYLEDPRVHVPIYRQLLGHAVVTPAEFKAAIATYDALPEPACVAELKEFRRIVRQLLAEHSGATDPEDIVIAIVKALAAAKDAKEACADA